MATWVVGDIHGCYRSFEALLEKINLQRNDKVICVGDLINRGPDSLLVLERFATDPQLNIVLGNHDLAYLLWAMLPEKKHDATFEKLYQHANAQAHLDFLKQSLIIQDLPDAIIVHAGLWPWAPWGAQKRAALTISDWIKSAGQEDWQQLESCLRGPLRDQLQLQEGASEPLRYISSWLHVFLSMRCVHLQSRSIDFSYKGYPLIQRPGFQAWFEALNRDLLQDQRQIVFGHWSALEGLFKHEGVVGLDTGCVWGGALTAYCLETAEFKTQLTLDVVRF